MNSTGHGEVGRESSHVRLLVKAPDQEINDQTVKCTLDWTVARLKDHLAQVYPSKPKREEQKIIFSGQLLTDSTILKDVLQHYCNPEDTPYVVHLVCGGQLKSSSMGKTSCAQNASQTNISASSGPLQSTLVQQYYSQLNNQQMAWMQHAYAHYLTRYMQIMAAQGIHVESASLYTQPLNVNASASETTNNNANNNNNNNNNNNVEENEAENEEARVFARADGAHQPAGQAAVDANPVNNNNNAAAAADEAAGGAALNRDWLDIFDMLSRIVVLSSIVYFYSSPSRFLIVTFLGFAIYLIQGGFFRGQPAFLIDNNNARVVDNNNQVGQNEVGGQNPAAAAAAPVAQQIPRIPSPSPGEQHVEATRTDLNEENERPGAWAFTWTFFSSFFASLIPDQPNVI